MRIVRGEETKRCERKEEKKKSRKDEEADDPRGLQHGAPPLPAASSSTCLSILPFSAQAHSKRLCSSTPTNASYLAEPEQEPRRQDFSALPFDLVARIAAAFTVPNLWAMSQVCRAWQEALRPLREAMALLRWGKRFKHGGSGVRRNPTKALDSFLKAAARGSSLAMVDAGLLFWEMGDRPRAVSLYRSAASLGDPAGLCNLGIAHLQAEPPMLEEAVKCFRQAASSGHVRAQYNLALCLHQGRGIQYNVQEAAKWYLKAAEGGFARAMYNTSLCYSSGEGFRRNHRQANKWMKRAADCGHSKAQFEYGLKLFSTGEMTTALIYLELAVRGGEAAANHVKNVLLQQLSPASRNRAMLHVDNWRASRPSR